MIWNIQVIPWNIENLNWNCDRDILFSKKMFPPFVQRLRIIHARKRTGKNTNSQDTFLGFSMYFKVSRLAFQVQCLYLTCFSTPGWWSLIYLRIGYDEKGRANENDLVGYTYLTWTNIVMAIQLRYRLSNVFR